MTYEQWRECRDAYHKNTDGTKEAHLRDEYTRACEAFERARGWR